MSDETSGGSSFTEALRNLTPSASKDVTEVTLPPDEVVTITEVVESTSILAAPHAEQPGFASALKDTPAVTQRPAESAGEAVAPTPSLGENGEAGSATADAADVLGDAFGTEGGDSESPQGGATQDDAVDPAPSAAERKAVGDKGSASAIAMGVGAGVAADEIAHAGAGASAVGAGKSAGASGLGKLKSLSSGSRPTRSSGGGSARPNSGNSGGGKAAGAKEQVKGKAKDAAKQAAKKVAKKVAANAVSAIASNPVTAGIALAVLLGIGLVILLLASFAGSGGVGEGAMAPSAAVIKEIPAAYLVAYEKAAADNGVPWTVLAAIGKLATDHGRFGPLDASSYGASVDRDALRQNDADPRVAAALKTASKVSYRGALSINQCDAKISRVKDSSCPVLPAIGVGNSPKGPMLLTAASVVALGGQNPQDINVAAEFVARQLATAESSVIANDPSLSDWTSNASSADKLWTAAVDQITGKWVANPNSVATKCVNSVPQGSDVPNLIKFMVSCQAEQLGGLQVVSSEKIVAKVATYKTLTGSAATAQITNEALSVAYAFSNFGTAKCSNSVAAAQGLFPLTKAEAPGINRCDVVANANRAVSLVLAGEVSDPATRSIAAGRYAPMLGGWLALPAVFGSDLPKLLANGPYQPSTPSAFCTGAVDTWILKIASKIQAGAGIAQAIASVTLPSHTQGCNLELKDPLTLYRTASVRVGGLTTDLGEGPNAASLLTFTAVPAISNTAAALLSTTALNSALLQLQSYLQTDALLLELAISPSSQVPFSRLSLNGIGVTYPTPNPTLSLPDTASYGASAVAQSILFGGDFPTDTRGADVAVGAAVSGRGRGSFIPTNPTPAVTTVGSGDAIALTQIDPSVAMADPWSSSSKVESFSSCGDPGNVNFTAQVAVVAAWENMCEDALADGVNLRIAAATRSNKAQQAVVSRLGSSLAAPAAVSASGGSFDGGSVNEKGLVVELSSTDPAGANWAHAVVGCFKGDPNSTTGGLYQNLPAAVNFQSYAAGKGGMRCPKGLTPVTRLQTYGFVALCKSYTSNESWSDPAVLACLGPEAGGGAIRAWWNLQLGGVTPVTLTSTLFHVKKVAPLGSAPAGAATGSAAAGGTASNTSGATSGSSTATSGASSSVTDSGASSATPTPGATTTAQNLNSGSSSGSTPTQKAAIAKAAAQAKALAAASGSSGGSASPSAQPSTSATSITTATTKIQTAAVAQVAVADIQVSATNIAELAQAAQVNLDSLQSSYNATMNSYGLQSATVSSLESYIASLEKALPKGVTSTPQITAAKKKLAAAQSVLKTTAATLKSKAAQVAAAKKLYLARQAQAQAELAKAAKILKGLSKSELAKLLALQAAENSYYQKISVAAAKSKIGATGAEAVALKFAFSQIGKVYVFGGSGLTYWDCSGLVMKALQQVGISTPHSAAAQANYGKAVALGQIRPGDLLFFGAPVISHVGIYIGNGRMLDAPHTGALVRVDTFGSSFGTEKLVAARRF